MILFCRSIEIKLRKCSKMCLCITTRSNHPDVHF